MNVSEHQEHILMKMADGNELYAIIDKGAGVYSARWPSAREAPYCPNRASVNVLLQDGYIEKGSEPYKWITLHLTVLGKAYVQQARR